MIWTIKKEDDLTAASLHILKKNDYKTKEVVVRMDLGEEKNVLDILRKSEP